MPELRRPAAIRILRTPTLAWSDADVTAWLDLPLDSPKEAHSPKESPQPPTVKTSQPTHNRDPATSHPNSTALLPASELLSRCKPMSHDPLRGWSLDIETVRALLIQCPLLGTGTTAEDVQVIGDISLASAILSRLPPNDLVPITIHNSPRPFFDRLNILLRAPTEAHEIAHELSRHTHLLPAGALRDSDVASYLGVTEAAIRKARSRARKDGQT